MELHKKYIQDLCRVCGKKLKGYTHDKAQDQCREALLSAFQFEVGIDSESIHPPSVCHCYFVTMRKLQAAKEEGRLKETDLIPREWYPHADPCQFCQDAPVVARGRPRKRVIRGRPSAEDNSRQMIQHITANYAHTPWRQIIIC